MTENWDDDFEFQPSPIKRKTNHDDWPENWDDNSNDNEEDTTVTRRLALSPASSVFSVPMTINSTSLLRPHSAFAALPPSPPNNRERERRRLKKKTRPRPPDVFELEPTDERVSCSEDGYASASEGHGAEPLKSDAESIISPPPPPTPSLLTRIGSVKRRWEARKRSGSTTPADVVAKDQHTPRPQSSLPAIQKPPAPPPPTASGWFFRPSSSGSPSRSSSSAGTGVLRGYRAATIDEPFSSTSNTPTPTKLVKRKSLGFVQLSRNLGGHSGTGENEEYEEYGKDWVSRYANGTAVEEVEDRPRRKSLSRLLERPVVLPPPPPEKEKEAPRSFIRRLSLASPTRHRRTKTSSDSVSTPAVLPLESPPVLPPVPTTTSLLSLRLPSNGSESIFPRSEVSSKISRRRLSRSSRKSVDEPRHSISSSRRASIDIPLSPPPPLPKTPLQPTSALLPPIELHPPSPPRPVANSERDTISMRLEPFSPTSHLTRLSPKSQISPHVASLGRATPIKTTVAEADLFRRSSLGDFKIPARISQAQNNLKRDLGMVRDFANHVEQLKQLQQTYVSLVSQVQQRLDAYAAQHAQDQHSYSPYPPATSPPPTPSRRSLSPTFFKYRSKADSSVKAKAKEENEKREVQPTPSQVSYKELATKFYSISSRHQISWECAELLVDLAGASDGSTTDTPPPTAGLGSPETSQSQTFGSPMSWKGSTGRNDLSHRQLILLREMLNHAPSEDGDIGSEDGFGNGNGNEDGERPVVTYGSNYGSISQLQLHDGLGMSVNREWRWGDAGNSTVTLGMEEGEKKEKQKKRRSFRLGSGMVGIRDMLRALKKSRSDASNLSKQQMNNVGKRNVSNSSTTSLSTQGSHRYPHPRVTSGSGSGSGAKRRSRTSLALFSAAYDESPPPPPPPSSSTKTHRRPSLASIFRLGSKKSGSLMGDVAQTDVMASPPPSGIIVPQESPLSSALGDSDTEDEEEEEDWDRMDSASDFEARVDKHATLRGKGKMPPMTTTATTATTATAVTTTTTATTIQTTTTTTYTTTISSSPSAFSSSRTSLFGNGIGLGLPSGSTSTPAFVAFASPGGSATQQGRPPPRLSNTDEHQLYSKKRSPSATRPGSAGGGGPGNGGRYIPLGTRVVSKTGSVRSIISPVRPSGGSSSAPIQETGTKLAMAPENIKPLLENAKVVVGRLVECVEELKGLVREHDGVLGGGGGGGGGGGVSLVKEEEQVPTLKGRGQVESLEGNGDTSFEVDELGVGVGVGLAS